MKQTAMLSTLCLASASVFANVGGICEQSCYGEAYNPPLVRPECCGFSGHIDYLYYKAGNELAPYIEFSTPDSSHLSGKNKSFNYDWNSGFRVGINYSLPCDCWTLSASWLHYDNKTSIHKETSWNDDSGSFIQPLYGFDVIGLSMSDIQDRITSSQNRYNATARLSINEIDIRASREYYVGKCVTIAPFAAFKSSFITTRLNQQFEREPLGARIDSTSELQASELKSKTDFKAAGIASGLHSTWLVGCGLGFYAKGEVALYYSDFDILEKQDLRGISLSKAGTGNQHVDFSSHLNTLTYQLDYGLGLRWIVPFNCDQSMFSLNIGWEGKYLADMNRISGAELNPRAPLTLHGITLGVALTY